jgi:predicted RNase H-like nuclease (RuvC/YqgF family)
MWDKDGIRIIGIDPGFSTGIVMVEVPDRVLTHKTFVESSPVRYIRDLVGSFPTALVVVEKEPEDGDHKQKIRVQRIVDALEAIHRIPNMMYPSEWKPFAKAQKWDYANACSQHEKDAYCIARYFATFKVKR